MEKKNDLQKELDRYACRLRDELNARLRREYGEKTALQVEDIRIRLLSAGRFPRQQ